MTQTQAYRLEESSPFRTYSVKPWNYVNRFHREDHNIKWIDHYYFYDTRIYSKLHCFSKIWICKF